MQALLFCSNGLPMTNAFTLVLRIAIESSVHTISLLKITNANQNKASISQSSAQSPSLNMNVHLFCPPVEPTGFVLSAGELAIKPNVVLELNSSVSLGNICSRLPLFFSLPTLNCGETKEKLYNFFFIFHPLD